MGPEDNRRFVPRQSPGHVTEKRDSPDKKDVHKCTECGKCKDVFRVDKHF